MTTQEYDLAIVGAGSGGLTAAAFAARLGVRVALIEKHKIGGDCTWTGCVPSKALLKAAKVAHEARTASHYGIRVTPPVTDMFEVRDYVRGAIARVYQFETPEELRRQGIDVIAGAAQFVDLRTVVAGEQTVRAKTFLIASGARPTAPGLVGIEDVPYLTYEQIFDNDSLPPRLIVVGGGPVGSELAQAYQRLGSQVTVVARTLLPKEEPEAREAIEKAFVREGGRLVRSRAKAVRRDGAEIVLSTDPTPVAMDTPELRADMLLIAAGRAPNVAGMDLDRAGVEYSEKGIPVDNRLQTNVAHIYAAGDVLGGYQFTHFAGWQACQAARNALLPGHSSGFTAVVPRVTYTDPEVAQVGLTEAEARKEFNKDIKALRWDMSHTDRAVCENDEDGFIKVITRTDGTILGATIVAGRAGETITEFILALRHGWKIADLAGSIHPYPTYSTAIQQLGAQAAIDNLLSGTSGRLLLGLAKLIR